MRGKMTTRRCLICIMVLAMLLPSCLAAEVEHLQGKQAGELSPQDEAAGYGFLGLLAVLVIASSLLGKLSLIGKAVSLLACVMFLCLVLA